jgi:CheY-like chemotaxis protein
MAEAAKRLNCIFLVDDDPVSIFLTSTYLEDLQICNHIQVASNGVEAFDLVTERCIRKIPATPCDCPDLIILDIDMPLMNGFDFLEQCQRAGYFQKLGFKVIILTSSRDRRDKERAQKYPIIDYLVKPVTESEWLTVLDREFDL